MEMAPLDERDHQREVRSLDITIALWIIISIIYGLLMFNFANWMRTKGRL